MSGTGKLEKGEEAISNVLEKVFKQLQAGATRSSLTLAMDTRDSYAGQIITCTHTMMVTLQTACCVTNPEVHTNVFVQPELPSSAANVAPGVVQGVVVMPEIDKVYEVPSAPPLPEGWSGVPEPEYEVPMAQAVLGGMGSEGPETGEEEGQSIYPVATPTGGAGTMVQQGSLAALHTDLDATFDDLGTIRKFLAAGYGPALATITPSDFGALVAKVSFSLDQPNAAEVLAQQLGDAMTCAHAAAGARAGSDLARTDIVKKLVPLCRDRAQNVDQIKQILSPFELMVAETYLSSSA